MTPNICNFGDGALLLTLPASSPTKLPARRLRAIASRLETLGIFEEIVPAYDSLLVEYDPGRINQARARKALELALSAAIEPDDAPDVIDIPVIYGGEYGPDLKRAAKVLSLPEDEIIALHSAPIYDVAMLGFIPGFCFLSAIDERLHLPRHATPRAKVAPGSVGIANWQTGIYGLQSPGGWQIIGRTPLTLFDPSVPKPSRLCAGDRVRFVPITEPEFKAYGEGL